MAPNPLKPVATLALAPVRLAGRIAGEILGESRPEGQDESDRPAPTPARSKRPKPRAAKPRAAKPRAARSPSARPKPLDDVTIARKVETTIFRGIDIDKGKVDVNVAETVVWLRGEVRTPDLIRQLEARARAVPEVGKVENLLHLPKTPAPSRTDTPEQQRKTRSQPYQPEEQILTPGNVTEEAEPPAVAEPSPREVAASGSGRAPAPMGSKDDGGGNTP
jgi:BON domain